MKYWGGGFGRKNKTVPGEMSLAVSNLDEENKEAVLPAFHLSLSFVNKCF